MKRRLFTAADVTPTESLLRKGLGKAMDYYYGIVSKSGEYRKQWQYSRGNGWILKVDDTRKALYYLTPLEDGIEVSLTLRDAERDQLMKDHDLREVQPLLEAATRYPEGFALRFDIESAAQYAPVARFLVRLMEIRGAEKPAPSKPRAPRKAANTTSKAAPEK